MVYHFDLHVLNVFVREKRKAKYLARYLTLYWQLSTLLSIINKGLTHKTTDTTQGFPSTCQAASQYQRQQVRCKQVDVEAASFIKLTARQLLHTEFLINSVLFLLILKDLSHNQLHAYNTVQYYHLA